MRMGVAVCTRVTEQDGTEWTEHTHGSGWDGEQSQSEQFEALEVGSQKS